MVARGRNGYKRDRITNIVGLKSGMLTLALVGCAAYTLIAQPESIVNDFGATSANVAVSAATSVESFHDEFVNDVIGGGGSRHLLKIYSKNHDDDDKVWSKDNKDGFRTCKTADQVRDNAIQSLYYY
jgi:hypothetical protein